MKKLLNLELEGCARFFSNLINVDRRPSNCRNSLISVFVLNFFVIQIESSVLCIVKGLFDCYVTPLFG